MGIAYTEKQTKELVERYLSGEVVDSLAVAFNRTRKSVIAKLSKEGVYVKKGYVTKKGLKPILKSQLVKDIEEIYNERFIQLDKVPKPTLEKLRNCIVNVDKEGSDAIIRVAELEENIEILQDMLESRNYKEKNNV